MSASRSGQGGLSTSADPGPIGQRWSEAQWEERIQRLIDEGQCFQAFDLSRKALAEYPSSVDIQLLSALALVRGGAVAEAHKQISPIAFAVQSQRPLIQLFLARIRERLPSLLQADACQSTAKELDDIAEIAELFISIGNAGRHSQGDSVTALRRLGQIYFESWQCTGSREDLIRGRDTFFDLFHQAPQIDGASNVAFLSWLLGEAKTARDFAAKALALAEEASLAEKSHAERYFALARQGEACLLLDDGERAIAIFHQAAADHPHYAWIVETRGRLLHMQAAGLDVPATIFTILPPPRVVIFSGQGIDSPDAAEVVFPPPLEDRVRNAIKERLNALAPDIGYCSAGAGSDLLFIEAMLERDAEVQVFLPFDQEDFIQTKVAYAGPSWERRFRNALRLVTQTHFVTREHYLGHDVLFRFTNQVIDGMTRLRASLLGTAPHLMLVWDPFAEHSTGTVSDFMDHWPDITTLHLLQLDDLRQDLPQETVGNDNADHRQGCVGSSPYQPQPARVIKSMLFADIVGFSKLQEEELPGLWRLLQVIYNMLDKRCSRPELTESWGDALYIVMPTAREMLSYAFVLQEGFANLDVSAYRLAQPLQIRIALHTGPVYRGRHPFTGREIIYGSHVSRAARIEPVTIPGQIYASQQFVATLTSEESAFAHASALTGDDYRPWYVCAYIGDQPLAKQYGNQPVYHLRRK